ncbi:MAG: KpsF/GutQ family sugar-phosphate isomerase, partial [Deltaproteobacteria bacterium]|nr:KpsF/GutQ family sugar-phosphate isomerase [Deltaproteobacteria bacterium]
MMIEEAKRVLALEAKAIEAVKDRLDGAFDDAVQAILHCEGRVIVMGMGKPGFIAGKLAATMASTGTPSFALHPADATHGDLGMITKNDVILAISNSGETPEIVNILETIKKIGAQLICMTGNLKSSLARHSDICLDVSVEQEACPMNLAPTTSTTAALALGDALAVVLIQQRGFKPEDFAFLHPGGSLGKKLLKVEEIMRTGDQMPCLNQKASVHDALLAITEARAGCCIVTGPEETLVGIFT